jgi:predicted transcriptional regulator YdeE
VTRRVWTAFQDGRLEREKEAKIMSDVIEITEEELYQAMLKASKASIQSFAEKHKDKCFYGFTIETLAEEGYFQMAANTEADLEKLPECYREEEKWNNQAWVYFDFNNHNDTAWTENWKVMQEKIDAFKSSNWTEEEYTDFKERFKSAAVAVLQELKNIGIFDILNTTDYFKTEVFEHHDRW